MDKALVNHKQLSEVAGGRATSAEKKGTSQTVGVITVAKYNINGLILVNVACSGGKVETRGAKRTKSSGTKTGDCFKCGKTGHWSTGV